MIQCPVDKEDKNVSRLHRGGIITQADGGNNTMTKGLKLRRLLKRKGLIYVVGAHDGLGAKTHPFSDKEEIYEIH